VKIQALIRVMTWNAANLTHHGRELALFNLLVSNHVDVMVVTEAELPTLTAALFALPGYTSFLSQTSAYLDKCRVVTLVRSPLAIEANARDCVECDSARGSETGSPGTQTVWVRLNLKNGVRKKKTVLVGGTTVSRAAP
jgi:hypothetical protein